MTLDNSQRSLFEGEASSPSTSLPGASPAKTSARQEKVKASKAPVPDSGLKCSASSAKSDQLGSWLRTFLLSALAESTPLPLAWKPKDTPSRRRWWWVLGRSAHRTAETGCGLWPTPAAAQAIQGENEPDGRRGQTLVGAARGQEWPTPNTVDAKGGTRRGEGQTQLCHIAGQPDPANSSTNGKRLGLLNPAWVTQLMGYPDDWLDIEPRALKLWETP